MGNSLSIQIKSVQSVTLLLNEFERDSRMEEKEIRQLWLKQVSACILCLYWIKE